MKLFFEILLGIHIIAGFSSIVIFWAPIFFKKGDKNHRITGKIYVYFMWVVVSTAFILSIENFIQGDINTALFLGFLSILSANPIWYGVAILNQKRGISESYRKTHYGFNILVFTAGLALVMYGISILDQRIPILMFIFGGLGIANGITIIKDYNKGLKRLNWFQHHYKGMVISAIAAYTAFFSFGGREFFSAILPGQLQVIPWILPTIIGVIAMRLLDRYYIKKGVIKA
ncbi:MAG: hypothetical protein AAF363_17330 [Bacteroidota bacterium]